MWIDGVCVLNWDFPQTGDLVYITQPINDLGWWWWEYFVIEWIKIFFLLSPISACSLYQILGNSIFVTHEFLYIHLLRKFTEDICKWKIICWYFSPFWHINNPNVLTYSVSLALLTVLPNICLQQFHFSYFFFSNVKKYASQIVAPIFQRRCGVSRFRKTRPAAKLCQTRPWLNKECFYFS